MKKYKDKEVEVFLRESNAIEQVYSEDALEDAIKAWNYLKEKTFLTPEVILATHNFLMRNLEPEIAGNWRNCNVWIGGKIKAFISVQLIEDDIRNFLVNMGVGLELPKEDLERWVKNCHIAFEGIHPFTDGNGRVGRLLYLWQRMKLGLPIHVIHADWPKEDGEQKAYYRWFK